MRIDHIIWVVPELGAGMAQFEELTGIRPAAGGSHPGHGTRNALVSLGDGCYLEIMAPDPLQHPDTLMPNNLLGSIAGKRRAGLYTFVVPNNDFSQLAAGARRVGVPFEGPVPYSRELISGSRLHWRMGFTGQTPFGPCLPFHIDWQDTEHPSKTAPQGLTILDWEVLHPQTEALCRLYDALDVDVRVQRADQPGFRAQLLSPKGEITLTSEG